MEKRPYTRCEMGMASGRLVNLLDVQPGDINTVDVAHGLSRNWRYGGQTNGLPYTVADHLILGDQVLRRLHRLACERDPLLPLAWALHDVHEALVTDLVEPVKRVLTALGIRDEYDRFIARIDAAVFTRYGLPFETSSEPPYTRTAYDDIVRDIDFQCYLIESVHLRAPPDVSGLTNPMDSPEHRAHLEADKWRAVPLPPLLVSAEHRQQRFHQHFATIVAAAAGARPAGTPKRAPAVSLDMA